MVTGDSRLVERLAGNRSLRCCFWFEMGSNGTTDTLPGVAGVVAGLRPALPVLVQTDHPLRRPASVAMIAAQSINLSTNDSPPSDGPGTIQRSVP
ncbi:MAG: hypothetical protein R2705_01300 [Ilumatobacteraceae bacterium]